MTDRQRCILAIICGQASDEVRYIAELWYRMLMRSVCGYGRQIQSLLHQTSGRLQRYSVSRGHRVYIHAAYIHSWCSGAHAWHSASFCAIRWSKLYLELVLMMFTQRDNRMVYITLWCCVWHGAEQWRQSHLYYVKTLPQHSSFYSAVSGKYFSSLTFNKCFYLHFTARYTLTVGLQL
jgi:hypothetical protein